MKLEEIRQLVRMAPVDPDPVRRRLSHCHSIDDLRAVARRGLPRSVFDYIDGAADEEVSLAANRAAFRRYRFVPRMLRDVGTVSLATRVLDAELSVPIGLAPTGYTGIVNPAGEVAVARAAARHGVPYVLSTVGTTTIEDFAATGQLAPPNLSQPFQALWFQLYILRDRGLTWSLVERAAAAGLPVLEVTLDTAVPGRRLRDVRNGFTIPPTLTLTTLADIGVHFRYWTQMVTSTAPSFVNIASSVEGGPATLADLSELFDPALTWDDLAELRSRWPGKLLVKGPLAPDDAARAVAAGADGIHLSNHGGRQLDRTLAPVELIRPVRERVGADVTIVADSGIRHGADALIALAFGADLCMVGRAYLYGLAAGGEPGVSRAVELLTGQLRRTMQLCGVRTLAELRENADEIVVQLGQRQREDQG
jgi:L-lactate dehydrogenase (cytochrome)